MAQLGRYSKTIINTSGEPVTSVSVEVRRQGATTTGSQSGVSPLTLNVESPGAIIAGDVVVIGTGSTSYNVDSITATTVVVSGFGGSLAVTDDERLSPTNSLPSLYADSKGTEAKTNPLTTDAAGTASAWLTVRPVDVRLSGTGVTTKLLEDEYPDGHETVLSNIMPGAGPAYIMDTLRALTVEDKILSIREAGVEKASIDDDGDIAGAKGTFSGAVASSAGVSGTSVTATTGNVAITAGNLTFGATGANIIPGPTALLFRNAANSATNITLEDDGDMDLRGGFFTKRLGSPNGTALVAGDFALSAGWGDTASVSGVTAGSQDGRGAITITCNGAGIAANPTVTVTWKDGTFAALGHMIACSGDGTSVKTSADIWYINSAFTTTGVFTYGGTPTATRTYELCWIAISRGPMTTFHSAGNVPPLTTRDPHGTAPGGA